MGPPEGIVASYLILFEFSPDTPSLIISESITIFLEDGVDSRDA
jgi:hypothetical protein